MLRPQPDEPGKGQLIRAAFIGLALIAPNIMWLVRTELVRGVYPTWLTLFPNVVFIIFVLALLSRLLKRFGSRLALADHELAVIYVILSVSTAVFARDSMRILFHYMGAAHWYATAENDWASLFWKYLPDWLIVSDQATLEHFYRGGEPLYFSDYLRVWAKPFLIWGCVAFLVVFVMGCISSIMRRQAVEHEHLSYPVIQLPLYMSDSSRNFLGNKLMWIGFGIAGGIDILNGLHFLYPAVPHLDIYVNIGQYFNEKPLNAIGWTPLCFYPFAVGFSYMMPLSLSFSCWIFYLLLKLEMVLRSALGLRFVSGYTRYGGHQAFGAWLCLAVTWIWAARRHLRHVLLVAMGKKEPDDDKEAMSYRKVVVSMVLAVLALIAFSAKAGFPVWVSVIFILIYFLVALSVARMRAQLGPPTHDIDQVGPEEPLIVFLGTRRIGAQSLAIFPLFSWLGSWNYRGHPIGHQLEGLKIADEAHVPARKVFIIMMCGVGLTVLIGPWLYMRCAYGVGIDLSRSSHVGLRLYRRWSSRLINMPGADWTAGMEMGIGFGMTLVLSIMQRLFLFWPLHPLGYAIAGGSYIMSWLWFSILVGWLCKLVLLKYGGARLYRRMSFLFLGALLGQFVVGSSWTLLGALLNKEFYGFFP